MRQTPKLQESNKQICDLTINKKGNGKIWNSIQLY